MRLQFRTGVVVRRDPLKLNPTHRGSGPFADMTYGTLGGNLKLNLIACDFIIAQKIIDFREYNLLGLPCIINVSMKDQSFYKSLFPTGFFTQLGWQSETHHLVAPH